MKKQKIINTLLLGAIALLLIFPLILVITDLPQYIKLYDVWSQSRQPDIAAEYAAKIAKSIIAIVCLSLSLIADCFALFFHVKSLSIINDEEYDRAVIEKAQKRKENAEHKKAERLAKKREKLQKQLDELPRD